MKITKNELKEIIKEEIELFQSNEAIDYDKVKIPSNTKKLMDRFTNALKDATLSRKKQIAVLVAVIKSLNISEKELIQYMQKIKQGIE